MDAQKLAEFDRILEISVGQSAETVAAFIYFSNHIINEASPGYQGASFSNFWPLVLLKEIFWDMDQEGILAKDEGSGLHY